MARTDRGLPIFNRSLSHAFVTELSRLSFEAIASFQAAAGQRLHSKNPSFSVVRETL